LASKITYRSVAALLALTTIPTVIFASFIRIVVDVALLKSYVGEDFSLLEIYDQLASFGVLNGTSEHKFELTDGLRTLLPALIAFAACLALTLIISIAAACFAAFSNKKIVILCLSGAAALTAIAMFISFRQFASPLISGAVSIDDLGVLGSGILNSVFGVLVSIKILQISDAGFLLLFEMLGLAAWTGAFVMAESGEKNTARKAGKKHAHR